MGRLGVRDVCPGGIPVQSWVFESPEGPWMLESGEGLGWRLDSPGGLPWPLPSSVTPDCTHHCLCPTEELPRPQDYFYF